MRPGNVRNKTPVRKLGLGSLTLIPPDDSEEEKTEVPTLETSQHPTEGEFLSPRSATSSIQGMPMPEEADDPQPQADPSPGRAAQKKMKTVPVDESTHQPTQVESEESDEDEAPVRKPKRSKKKVTKPAEELADPAPTKVRAAKKRLSVFDIAESVPGLAPSVQKLVDTCVEMWRVPATVKTQGPCHQPERYQVSPELGAYLHQLADASMTLLTQSDSWLSSFRATRTGTPMVAQPIELFELPLEALNPEGVIAVLQTLLASAGYGFVTAGHQVSDWNSPLMRTPLTRATADANRLRESLKKEVIAWTRAFSPLLDHDPRAYRQMKSSMATSDSEEEDSSSGEESEESYVAPARPGAGLAKLMKATKKLAIAPPAKVSQRPVTNPFEYRRAESMSDDPMTGGYPPSAGMPSPTHQNIPAFSFAPAPAIPVQGFAMPKPAFQSGPMNFTSYGFAGPTPPGKKFQELVAAPPYVPIKDLPVFKGTEDMHAAKDWLRELRHMASEGRWSEGKKCESMKLRLRGGAKSWYSQLGPRKKHWDSLMEEFRREFCEGTKTKIQLYYEMKNTSRQSARMYMYDLTAAAHKARISLTSPAELAAHVTRFVSSVGDSEACAVMGAEEFTSVEAMIRRLKTHERNSKSQVANKDREKERDRAREKERFKARDAERAAVKAATAYPVYDGEHGQNTFGRVKSPKDSRHVQFDDPSSSESDSGQVFRAEGREHRSNRDSPCFVCNKTGHWGKECPDRDRTSKSDPALKTVCSICSLTGHDATSCWKKCKICGKLHARGEACQTLEDLKAWVKSQGTAGCQVEFPASLLQALN